MSKYTVSKMDETTLSAVALLEEMCFSAPWSEKSLRDELSNENATWLVALTDDGTVAGYGGIHTFLDEGEIMNIAVHPTFRRQGIAEQIMSKLLECAPSAKEVFLEVRSSNIPAITLYKNAGFEEISVRKNYYQNPSEDAIIMRKLMGK